MSAAKSKRLAGPALQPDAMRPELVRVTLAGHRNMRFRPIADYFFASGLEVADIVAAELAQAAVNFPLAFEMRGETPALVALLSIAPGRNLFVSEKGTWLADLVPACICTYPFQYCAQGGTGSPALFIDMNSGLLGRDEGEPLFTEAGKPSDKTKEIVRILRVFEKSRRTVQKVCAQLQRYNLLVPWGPDCEVETLRRLLRVDELAFNRLPQGVFSLLRQAGALPVVYAHLLSLALLPRLATLARLHTAAEHNRQQLLRSCFHLDDNFSDTFKF